MSAPKEVPDGTSFPLPNKRKDFTDYSRLKKTPEGRRVLKQRGYVVRSKPAQMGAPAKARRASYRRENSKFVKSEFIGWDGEGCTVDGIHHFVLLQNSLGYCVASDKSTGVEGLPTTVCFEFLLDTTRQNPGAYHIIFSGNYDCNKILNDMRHSPLRLRKLYDKNYCHWGHYKIEWVPKKWLYIKDLDTKCENYGQSIRLFDVFSFFQTSFVKTLKQWEVDFSELDTIEQMKERRGEFDWIKEHNQIEEYCGLELEALVLLMEKFRENHLAAGLPLLHGWYGPGAIADGLLRRHTIKRDMLITTDTPANQAALYAFAAGRIERLKYGNYEGPVKIIDINSAYPYSISQLPSLNAGWKLIKTKSPPLKVMSMYHIKLYPHKDYASPLFFRKSNDKMFFPNPKGDNFTEHWIWTPEYYQLVKWKIPHECVECWLFQGDSKSRPFAWMEEMYYQRLKWKQQGNPAERNLKLALNSIYGKTVQQAGWEHHRKIPRYHQIEWGGYITSQTRAQLYEAMKQIKFQNVIGVETDSIILAGNKLPPVVISNELGKWGVTDYEGITYIQSGVYWLKTKEGWLDKYSKQRGYVPGTLTRDMILLAWESNPQGSSDVRDENSQTIGMTVKGMGNEFISLGHCYRPGQDLSNWGNWEVGPKKLSLWKATKRVIVREGDPRFGLLSTQDTSDFQGWSQPYNIVWGKDNESNPY